jgi:hypothetical protein
MTIESSGDYDSLYSIFPAHRTWPTATSDLTALSLDTRIVRLTAGAKNFNRLRALGSLTALWAFDINEEKLEVICKCSSLNFLFIENLKAGSLGGLSRLPNLEILGVESCSKVTSFVGLQDPRNLRGLALANFKNVHTLDPLAQLAGPKRLDMANFYPMQEFARLSVRLKTTSCTWFQPQVNFTNLTCRKCKKATMLILTGMRKPSICGDCDSKILTRHLKDWNEALAARR